MLPFDALKRCFLIYKNIAFELQNLFFYKLKAMLLPPPTYAFAS
ncbi:hypothetical protein HMPREF9151_02487 [Hoylesella saccharolytica F0055]|uniref:Uncharacterized protein n=1 Tax=Hoylesella saccharolytica F0055 TaxID=1127699 RepID=L1MYQ9_9BACT|nr:hypothetical protein HMPREF9151_02487 [Hoylesella saccharolytica F0055]